MINKTKAERFDQILNILKRAREPLAPYQIARKLTLSEGYVFKLLKELEQQGKVVRSYRRDPRTFAVNTVFAVEADVYA